MKMTAKLILSVVHHGWATMKMFHSRSSKTALKGIFLPFYFIDKHEIYILYQKAFMKNELHEKIVDLYDRTV